MIASLSVPSIYAVRITLEEIEGAIRLEPLAEDTASGRDLGVPVLHLGGEDRAGRALGPVDDEEAAGTFERPAVVFEVPPKVTDAEVFEALGDGAGELERLVQIEGTDALGSYMTFHQRAAQHGIYVPIEGIVELALSALGGLELTLERRLEIAFHSILRHELFHFEADCMAPNWELATRASVYWWAADEFRDTPGYKDLGKRWQTPVCFAVSVPGRSPQVFQGQLRSPQGILCPSARRLPRRTPLRQITPRLPEGVPRPVYKRRRGHTR